MLKQEKYRDTYKKYLAADGDEHSIDKYYTFDEMCIRDRLVLVRRLIKQRVEAAEMYKSGGAADRAERELAEAQVLEIYQPAQLSDEDILKIVAKVAEETGAAGPKDMGKMMGKTMAAVKGQADGNRVKSAVQHYLNQLVQ